jgi:hypothetical protein
MSQAPTFESIFAGYYRNPDGNVVIHPQGGYMGSGPMVLSAKFVEALRRDVDRTIRIAQCGVDDPGPLAQFALMVLAQSY